MRATFEPSPAAVALQAQIDAATLRGAPAVVGVGPGDLYFGTRSLIIHRASNLTLRSSAGPGAARLWFGIGAGILVNQSADVVLDGLDVDYDPPAHWQGTVVQVIDDRSSADIKAFVVTDPGFLDPATFDALYRKGTPGVQSSPVALVWNASDPEFGAYAPASWPPLPAPTAFQNVFTVPRASICTDINAVTTDGSSCLDGHAVALRAHDKVTAHIRTGFTLHMLNSSRVRTQHCAIHGAPGFAITEYDGRGGHSYYNVSVGRRRGANRDAMCGLSNPTGGRLCLGLVASNNDALHSAGCRRGPSFVAGELSYCLDDFVNIHSRAQVVLERLDARHLVMIDPRLNFGTSVRDDFPFGNAETLTNAQVGDPVSFFVSGNLTSRGGAKVRSTERATWEHDAALIYQAQHLLDTRFNATCGLDAGPHCRAFGCLPRVWRVRFDSDVPAWSEAAGARGVVASLDSWAASGAVVQDSHLHHGRYGVRWKSSDGSITGNRISARYMEISPLEYYMEGPFRLSNVTVANNAFAACAAPVDGSIAGTVCANGTHLPLGYWSPWVQYGGGTGGICAAAAVGASVLDPTTCTDVAIENNTAACRGR